MSEEKNINKDDKESGELIREMGLVAATAIVVGSMIGSGIFIAPSIMAGLIASPGIIFLIWIFAGIFTILGCLSYGELATMYPKAGGQYVFLREAYSPLIAFLFGWTLFLVIQTGFIAAVSVAFAKYLGIFIPFLSEKNILFSVSLPFSQTPFNINWAQVAGIISIMFLTFINTLGVGTGAKVQNISTILKVLAIFLLVFCAFFSNKGSSQNLLPLLFPQNQVINMALIAVLAVAMSKALFAYDAWNTVTFIAEEVKAPEKNLPRSLFAGALIVMVANALITLAYFYLIPVNDAASIADNRIGARASEIIFGGPGIYFISIAILISTFGCNNGLILGGARVFFAMARDKLFFKSFSQLDSKYKIPKMALYSQAVWASLLTLSGTYSDLLTYTTFASVLFNMMTVIGVFVLRKKRPNVFRPYKTVGHPFVPLIYILVALLFLIFIIQGDPINSLKGLGLVLLGIPVYFFFKKRAT
ncbi:MAG: amino acid permease [Oligoflexia bacterium]|nr:amino acid permease [Oligoflexia bacterium]